MENVQEVIIMILNLCAFLGFPKELWSCDFDSDPPWGPWCGMVQSVKDKFNWSVTNRGTPSQPTGPERAQNGNYYIYIETSNPRKPNETAMLVLVLFCVYIIVVYIVTMLYQ